MPAEEVADLVDADDVVIGRATRREIRAGKLLHRGVAVLCRNDAGQVYVHRRTDTKDVFPGLYDMFVGGMVAAGEDYAVAARREVHEELGITGLPVFLFKHRYDGRDNPCWLCVYEVAWDGPIAHQADEIAWGAFLSTDELTAKLDDWPFVPDGLEVFDRCTSRSRRAASRSSRAR